MRLKIKKDKLHYIYWTIAVVSICFLTLTNIDWQLVGGIATSSLLLIQALFDKEFSKKYFE